jgi:acyl carrier protein
MIKILVGLFGLAFLVVVLLCVMPSVIRMSRRSAAVQKRAKEVMRDRRAMSSSEFGSAFFPHDQAEITARVRDILKDVLIVDISRIHPDDRLVEDLGLGQVNGLDAEFLAADLEHKLGVRLSADAPILPLPGKTVRDLVTYVLTETP